MSCPKCGSKVQRKSLGMIFVLISLVVLSFGVSLFILPFGWFFLFSFVLIFGLRYIEKQFNSIDKQEIQCQICGHVVSLAHSH